MIWYYAICSELQKQFESGKRLDACPEEQWLVSLSCCCPDPPMLAYSSLARYVSLALIPKLCFTKQSYVHRANYWLHCELG